MRTLDVCRSCVTAKNHGLCTEGLCRLWSFRQQVLIFSCRRFMLCAVAVFFNGSSVPSLATRSEMNTLFNHCFVSFILFWLLWSIELYCLLLARETKAGTLGHGDEQCTQ